MRLPPLNTLSYNRAVFMTAVAIVILMSIGLEQILKQRLKFRLWFLIPFGLCILGVVGFGVSAVNLPEIIQTHLPNAVRSGRETKLTLTDVAEIQRSFFACYAQSAVICGLACVGWIWMFRGSHFRGWGFSIIVATMLGELIGFSIKESHLRDEQPSFPRIAALEKLATLPPGRIWGVRCLPPNLNRTHGLWDVRGYDAVDPENVVRLLKLASDPRYRSPNYAKTRDMVPILLNAQKHAMLHPIVNLLNVRYFISRTALTWPLKVIVHDRDYWVSENADALSRAFVPETVKQVDERVMIDQMDRIDFDARKTAYVMEDLGLPAECRGDVNLRDISPMEVELQVEMATDGLVVVSDMWDADWKGTIDGVPVPIIRTNTALRGIRTSSGKHVVRMEYRPAIVLTAFLGSLSAVFVIALWVIWLIVSSHSRWLVKGAKTGDQVDQP